MRERRFSELTERAYVGWIRRYVLFHDRRHPGDMGAEEATRFLWDAPLGSPKSVVLIFGRETGGLPDDLHERYRDRFVTMPILSRHVRSLNLSTSVAIALYEVLRQRRANDQ
jgi:tRNA(Leu) C34 or U34 (ribose-2'-O)-methylase TrmL